jgi:hypothetical protein
MPKPRRLIVVGNLTVRHYVLHRNGVEVPQWVVTSKDGKHSQFAPVTALPD